MVIGGFATEELWALGELTLSLEMFHSFKTWVVSVMIDMISENFEGKSPDGSLIGLRESEDTVEALKL